MSDSKICRPCFKVDEKKLKIAEAQTEMKREFRVDLLLKKLKVLEGIVKDQVLLEDELKWKTAFDKYSLFISNEPKIRDKKTFELSEFSNDSSTHDNLQSNLLHGLNHS